MVRIPYDLKAAIEENPRPKDLPEEEHWNPWSPRPEVLKAYTEANYKYDLDGHDRAGNEFFELVNQQPETITQELTQVYRIRVPNEGEYMFYDLTIRGNDWKGNEHDYAHRVGRFKMPSFRKERDPQTRKVTTSQINDHIWQYNIPWSAQKFDEIAQAATESLSLVIFGTAGRRVGIPTISDFRTGSYDDVVQVGMKGKSLESVVAEKNQFTYEKRETKKGSAD